MYYLFVFSSLTGAQRGAKVLNSVGISADIIKSPRAAVENGCSHGVRVPENIYAAARNELLRAGTPLRRVFAVYDNGMVRGV